MKMGRGATGPQANANRRHNTAAGLLQVTAAIKKLSHGDLRCDDHDAQLVPLAERDLVKVIFTVASKRSLPAEGTYGALR
jgi:hypothetical protein